MEGSRVICPHCGRLVIRGNFCTRCGAKLVEVCDCWVKKSSYDCGRDECPGAHLTVCELEDMCGTRILTQEDVLRKKFFSPAAEEKAKREGQDLRAIRYMLTAYRAEQKSNDEFLRRTIYTMQANRRLDWKVLLLVCSAGGVVGTAACILLAYLFGVILMEVHV